MTTMTDSRAVEVLAAHNEWRRYDGFSGEPGAPAAQHPTEIGLALDHAIARLREPAGVGGEWVLVPREPTFQMVLDGVAALGATTHEATRAIYAAMLASAPKPPAEAQPDWEAAPPGATHYQPHQDAYYKRVSASEWYVWSRKDDRELLRWLLSPGTGDSAEWVVRPAEAQAQGGGEVVAWFPTNGAGEILRNYGDGSPVYACKTKEQAEQVRRCHLGAVGPVIPLYSAPPSAPVASEHVRRLVGHLAQWVLCMSHNESYFGEAAGHLKSTVEELARSVDPIYPPKPSPSDSLAGVEIHTATVPFMPAQIPTTTAPPSAPVGVIGDAIRHLSKWLDLNDCECESGHQCGRIEVERTRDQLRALAQQPAADDGAREAMAAIGHLIATQDNRITASPIFIVQQKRLYAADPECDYDRLVWVDGDGEAGAEDAERLDAEYAETGIEPAGWRRAAEAHYWDFVTACFTEQGCKDYIARDGHNLREPRIYAAGSYRNTEWQAVRSYLIALAAQPQGASRE